MKEKRKKERRSEEDCLCQTQSPCEINEENEKRREGGGSIAKSGADAKSTFGNKIILPSFVILTNPRSACAKSTP